MKTLQRLLFTLAGHLFSVTAFAAGHSLANVMPAGVIAFAETDGLGAKVHQFQESKLFELILQSPQYQEFEKGPDYAQFMAGRKIVETFLGMDLWTTAEKLLGGQVALGLYPQPNKNDPQAVAILRTKDVETLKKLRGRLAPFVLLAGDTVKKEELSNGAELYTLEDGVLLAAKANWLAAAQSRPLLDQAMKMLTGEPGKSVAQDAGYVKFREQMGRHDLGQAYIDLRPLRKQAGPRLGIQKKEQDGGASFFLHGILELAAHSSYAGLTLNMGEAGMAIKAGVEGGPKSLPEKFQWFFSDPDSPGAGNLPEVPGLLGGIAVHRNIGAWYRQREQLLAEQLLPEFDKFEGEIGNLFGGQDFGEDVLPAIGSIMTLVTARQTFEHLDGAPGVKIPGFALIVNLEKPQEGADLFQLLFQTIITITNFEGKDKMRAPWILSAQAYKKHSITFAKYTRKPQGANLPVSANFQPAAVLVGNKFVISSTVQLAKALADALESPTPKARANRNFNLELRPAAWVPVLHDNRKQVIAQAIQKGQTIEQARWGTNAAEQILKSLGLLRLSTSVGRENFTVKLEARWQ